MGSTLFSYSNQGGIRKKISKNWSYCLVANLLNSWKTWTPPRPSLIYQTDSGFFYFTSNLQAFNKFEGLVRSLSHSHYREDEENRICGETPEPWALGSSSMSMSSSCDDLLLYIHKLSRQGIGYILKWEILIKAPPWNPISNICRLCIQEKHYILFHPEDSSLNQRSEFFTVCRHKEKHLLMKSWTAFF